MCSYKNQSRNFECPLHKITLLTMNTERSKPVNQILLTENPVMSCVACHVGWGGTDDAVCTSFYFLPGLGKWEYLRRGKVSTTASALGGVFTSFSL